MSTRFNSFHDMITRSQFVAYMVEVFGYESNEADEMFSDSGCDARELLSDIELEHCLSR
jgi:hypothetical protein